MVAKTRIKIIAAVTAALIVIIVAAVFLFCSGSGEKVRISVKSGEGAASVAKQLKENNLICSKTLFLLWAKSGGSAGKLKAGYYEFSGKDGMFKIIKDLVSGSKSLVKFTVPEGSNIRQTAEIIAEKSRIDKDKFIQTAWYRKMEGYLMPETYFIAPGMSEENIIDMMKKEFDKKVTPEMYDRAKELGMPMQDVIILASIVEKEAVNPDERTTIAAVFYNRLKNKMRLESCATVLYAMGVNKPRLTIEDTEFDSPYNTYRHSGLPPGPICSPGIESIRAALYPANTSNLYFVSAGDGNSLFADDLEQHIKNKNKSKRNIKEMQRQLQKKKRQ